MQRVEYPGSHRKPGKAACTWAISKRRYLFQDVMCAELPILTYPRAWVWATAFPEGDVLLVYAPSPPGLEAAFLRPNTAFYSPELSEFLLLYDDVRQAHSPEQALLDFFHSSYEAGATLAGWDRESLERHPAVSQRRQTMSTDVLGIHHVTAIASETQRNVDFYTGLLGLRLVKVTVNFDDPSSYHLYYGDEVGHPGTILTFFAWPGAPRGRAGTGQLSAVAFTISEASLDYWTAVTLGWNRAPGIIHIARRSGAGAARPRWDDHRTGRPSKSRGTSRMDWRANST